MGVKKRTISKAKGVEICAEWMFSGRPRKEIVQELMETYGISESSVDKYMKAARPMAQARQKELEAIRSRVDMEEAEASAKRLNLTKERLMEELAKVAYGDVRKILSVDGGMKDTSEWDDETAGAVAGIESYDEKTRTGEILGTVRKVKSWDKIRAIETLNKMLGYNAPEKTSVNVNLNESPVTFE